MPDRDTAVSYAPDLNPVSRVPVDAVRTSDMGRDGYEVLSRANYGQAADEYGFPLPRTRQPLARPVHQGPGYGFDN
jgi:hypothetical protein